MTFLPTALETLPHQQLLEAHKLFQNAYTTIKNDALSFDLTRGKPSQQQLDLSQSLLENPLTTHKAEGQDLRNYGGASGLLALREMFSPLLNVPVQNLLALGNSSLTLMHDTLVQALLKGVPGSAHPWSKQPISFLAPVPGYDRHFAICERYGIRLIPVPLNEDGPDIKYVEKALTDDPTIKGMWCVPVFSNPTGATYSLDNIQALLGLQASEDFRIFWDNAYAIHPLNTTPHKNINILELAQQANHPDRVFLFASTSKITFPGAGVAFWASSERNLKWFLSSLATQTIGPDKLNHMRHAQFFQNSENILHHMSRHRNILKPKFDAVDALFTQHLKPWNAGTWTKPEGGYFITLNVKQGCASKVVQRSKEAGVLLTPAGAPFPSGYDPNDSVLRISPSYPELEDITQAIKALCHTVLLVHCEALLAESSQ